MAAFISFPNLKKDEMPGDRCIEILKYHTSLFAPLRLIKTRVVLKFHSAFCTSINYWINKNKSCIEIAVAAGTGRVYAD